MASRYSTLKKEKTLGSINTKKISDLDETDPFYFIIRDNGKIVTEGDILKIKLRLPLEYFDRPIKSFSRNQSNMTATIDF